MGYRLLLADDSITIQKVVELVLAEEDFQIKSVGNGEDALKVIGDFAPDIVLADIDMPKVNGYQLCEKIKQNPATAHIPVILLAGAFEPIDEELARQIRADDSVVKPFESQELISKINAVLTMAPAAVEEEAVAVAEEDSSDIFEIAEEADAVAAAEPAEAVAAVEEDLWAMEDIPAVTDEVAVAAAVEEESDSDIFELAEEEAAEIPQPAFVPEPPARPEPPKPEPVRPEPVRPEPIREVPQPAPVREFAAPEVVMPSQQEIAAILRKSIDEKVAASLAGLDIKDAVLSTLGPGMKDSIDKVLWEVAPELVEKVLRDVLKGALSSLSKEVEKVIWETVPDLASTIINKEIEKIKSEI